MFLHWHVILPQIAFSTPNVTHTAIRIAITGDNLTAAVTYFKAPEQASTGQHIGPPTRCCTATHQPTLCRGHLLLSNIMFIPSGVALPRSPHLLQCWTYNWYRNTSQPSNDEPRKHKYSLMMALLHTSKHDWLVNSCKKYCAVGNYSQQNEVPAAVTQCQLSTNQRGNKQNYQQALSITTNPDKTQQFLLLFRPKMPPPCSTQELRKTVYTGQGHYLRVKLSTELIFQVKDGRIYRVICYRLWRRLIAVAGLGAQTAL